MNKQRDDLKMGDRVAFLESYNGTQRGTNAIFLHYYRDSGYRVALVCLDNERYQSFLLRQGITSIREYRFRNDAEDLIMQLDTFKPELDMIETKDNLQKRHIELSAQIADTLDHLALFEAN